MKKYPCIFLGTFVREQVDPRLYAINKKTPFGAFRKMWRQYHCAEINPYGSESCPYSEEDCAMAFLQVAERSLSMEKPTGYFRKMAQTRGYVRAENKPLARDREQAGQGGLRGGPQAGPNRVLAVPTGEGGEAGRPLHGDSRVAGRGPVGVHGSSHRLQSMGSLLRGDGAGSRTRAYGRHEGQEAADDHGDAGHPVSPPSPERLGDRPPSGDPDLHKGGE